MSSYQPATGVAATASTGNYANARRGVRNPAAVPTTANTAAAAPSSMHKGNNNTASTTTAASMAHAASAAGSPLGNSTMSDSLNRGTVTVANNNNNNNNKNNALASPRTPTEGKSAGTTDSVIAELKALANSMLEATNAARRRTSSIEHRNSYEALMHAIENRVNGDGSVAAAAAATPGAGRLGENSAANTSVGVTGAKSYQIQQPPQQPPRAAHADPNATESELLSAHLIEQLTDIPAELSPASRVRQLQQLEQLQQQQQQQRSKGAKGRNNTAGTAGALPRQEPAEVPANTAAAAAAPSKVAAALRTAAAPREVLAEDAVEEDEEGLMHEPPCGKPKDAVARRPAAQSFSPPPPPPQQLDAEAEEEDDDDGTAYDGVRALVLFKPVNRTAYHEVLASTWKPEGLTRRVPLEEDEGVADGAQDGAAAGNGKRGRGAGSGSSSGSSSSGSSSGSSSRSSSSDDGADDEDGGNGMNKRHHHHHRRGDGAQDHAAGEDEDEDDDEAIATVGTRNKARKASAAQPTRSMKVYRVPAFPYGGGVTEQQARLLQRQFDACIQNGEHLQSNATGPRLITKAAFDAYKYDEVDVRTAQLDVTSFQPTSPYEFVVEVEREVRFDAVKAREERRRRFKRLVHENRAPATMGTFDLRVIMDPFKTGFEEEKNFPIIPGTVIAGRYEIIQMLGKATFSRAVRCYDLHDPIYDDEGVEGEDDDAYEDDLDDFEDEGGEGHDSSEMDGAGERSNGASASPADNGAGGSDGRSGKVKESQGTSDKDGATSTTTAAAEEAKKQKRKKAAAKKRKLIGYGQVCLKIINNTKDFFDQSLDEIRLLTLLNRQRDPDDAHIVRLIDAFYYKEHVMLVTELLRDTLYDYGKYNREEEEEFYFTVPRLRRLTRQIVEALTYVHSLNLIHTDLKPENIMFVSYSRCIVKVIDFGSSCFLSDHLSSYIQSRSYRAPEVVLGCDYDGRIDVWSLGAILVEMVTGDVLFTSDTVPEMLARIVYVCGSPFPRHMLWEGRHTSDYINKFGCIYEYGGTGEDQRNNNANTSKGEEDGEEPYCLYTPVPTMAPHTCNAPKRSKAAVVAAGGAAAAASTRTPAGPYSVLREKLAAANMVDKDFVSFVEACLTLDHKKRPTTAQLLNHPFIKNERI